jgi:hypothetical protein
VIDPNWVINTADSSDNLKAAASSGHSTDAFGVLMTYEAPKITEAGRFSSTTLGDIVPLEFNDATYFWGAAKGSA